VGAAELAAVEVVEVLVGVKIATSSHYHNHSSSSSSLTTSSLLLLLHLLLLPPLPPPSPYQTPESVAKMVSEGLNVVVQSGAGAASKFNDEAYIAAGAKIVRTAKG